MLRLEHIRHPLTLMATPSSSDLADCTLLTALLGGITTYSLTPCHSSVKRDFHSQAIDTAKIHHELSFRDAIMGDNDDGEEVI